jgi:hypothetical protein
MCELKFNHIAAVLICTMCLLVIPVSGRAQNSSNSSNEWKFIGNIYLWAASIEGTTGGGNQIDLSFSDILDNLDFTFMGGLEARKSKWSLVGDLIYLSLQDGQGATLPSGGNIRTDVEIDGWVINLLAGYNLLNTPSSLVDVVFGARYLDLETTINTSLSGGQPRERSQSGNVWDGVIGIRGKQYLGDKWYIPYQLDIGTGDSDQTWQGMAGIAYELKRWNLALAYRHIEWEFDSDNSIDDLNFSGPGFLAQFRF